MKRAKFQKKAQPAEGIEEEIHRTELGDFVMEYRGAIIGGLVMIFVGIFGFSYYQINSENQKVAAAEKVYDFRETTYKDFQAKKIDPNLLVEKFLVLSDDLPEIGNVLQMGIGISKELSDGGKHQLAIKVLESIQKKNMKNKYSAYLLRVNLASLYENNGETQKAISLLEKVVQSETKFYEGKLYLDIGRLYLKEKNLDKAKLNLNYVIENYPHDDMAKLAKIYLAKMPQVK